MAAALAVAGCGSGSSTSSSGSGAPASPTVWRMGASTADTTNKIIPAMMKSLMRGANFTATVDNANTRLQKVLNTGSKS